MTEQKTIWHEPEEHPSAKVCNTIITKNGDVYHYSPTNRHFAKIVDILCKFVIMEFNHNQYWMYMNEFDDLLEQSDKVERLESEVSRYKAALELAKKHIDYLDHTDSDWVDVDYGKKALKEITQALEKEEK